MNAAIFHSSDFAHMIGAGYFMVSGQVSPGIYQITGTSADLPTIIDFKGRDITVDWFISSRHLRTKEIGFTWNAHFIPVDCVKDGQVVKPAKLRNFYKSFVQFVRVPTLREFKNL